MSSVASFEAQTEGKSVGLEWLPWPCPLGGDWATGSSLYADSRVVPRELATTGQIRLSRQPEFLTLSGPQMALAWVSNLKLCADFSISLPMFFW